MKRWKRDVGKKKERLCVLYQTADGVDVRMYCLLLIFGGETSVYG